MQRGSEKGGCSITLRPGFSESDADLSTFLFTQEKEEVKVKKVHNLSLNFQVPGFPPQ
jgi:hypothetical protein